MPISFKKRYMIKATASSGFTIVETLIAVAVLMIAIAGPLVVASKGLTSALASKNQMIASYLAQESMEIIKNRRDNNISSRANWLDGFNISTNCNSTNSTCDIGGLNTSPVTCTNNPNGRCLIYYNSSNGYNNVNSGDLSIFTRYFYLEARGNNNGKEERLAHVYVDWKEGTVPYQIHITSQLVQSIR